MTNLAILFRAAQFFSHFAHNTIKGPSFFSDHSFLGDLYNQYEGFYDDVIERMIGHGMNPDIADITQHAAVLSSKVMIEGDAASLFNRIIAANKRIYETIREEVVNASDGTQNLLQGFADELEVVDYKIRQRLS